MKNENQKRMGVRSNQQQTKNESAFDLGNMVDRRKNPHSGQNAIRGGKKRGGNPVLRGDGGLS